MRKSSNALSPPSEVGALTVNEASAYLRISRGTLYRLFATGDLRPAKVGGRTLVRRADADALLSRSAEASGPWLRSNRGEAARAARGAPRPADTDVFD